MPHGPTNIEIQPNDPVTDESVDEELNHQEDIQALLDYNVSISP